MIIKATPSQIMRPTVSGLIQKYIFMTGGHRFVNGKTEYPFSEGGEKYFTAVDLDTCISEGVEVDQLTGYVVLTQDELSSEVPTQFPRSEGFVDDVPFQRTWREYCPFQWILPTGDVLVRCAGLSEGATAGVGLPHEELLLWLEEFPKLMVKSEGEALIPEVVEE